MDFARVRILVVDRKADGDLERRGIGHAALFAFGNVVLQLQRDRVAALVAERGRVLVECAALGAQHVAGFVRVGYHRSAAIAAGGAQVVQAAQVAALAFPVADGVVDEVELRQAAKILDRKHGGEHGLQAGVFALAGQQVHLQKPLIGFFLDVDQVRDLNRRLDFGKIQPLAFPNNAITIPITHDLSSSGQTPNRRRGRHPPRRSGKDLF